MRLDLAFVDLDHRPQRLRLASCFGWLHHPSVLRGLTPPACTNLHSSNSIQMCERNPTLSAIPCSSPTVFPLKEQTAWLSHCSTRTLTVIGPGTIGWGVGLQT